MSNIFARVFGESKWNDKHAPNKKNKPASKVHNVISAKMELDSNRQNRVTVRPWKEWWSERGRLSPNPIEEIRTELEKQVQMQAGKAGQRVSRARPNPIETAWKDVEETLNWFDNPEHTELVRNWLQFLGDATSKTRVNDPKVFVALAMDNSDSPES